MRNKETNQKRWRVALGILALAMTLSVGLLVDSMVSLAAGTGKITASSAKVRKSAVSGDVITSLPKGTQVTIDGETQGSDNYKWYQITSGTTQGYVRSDLIEVTGDTAGGSQTVSDEGVTKVNPVSASISGGTSVRVRSKASTDSTIVETVSNGLAVTVTGKVNGTDGKLWYMVTYSANGKEVTGFVRSEFATLSGELTEYSEPDEPDNTPSEPAKETEPAKPAEEEKAYYTIEQDGKWFLVDQEKGEGYDILEMFDKVTNNEAAYNKANKTAKKLRVVLIIVIILFFGAVALAIYFLTKAREMADAMHMKQVENETIKRRNAERARQDGRRPEGQRSAQRPDGQRPAQRPDGQRPAQRPDGQRPAQRPDGQRPAQRPEGQRPAQNPNGPKMIRTDENGQIIEGQRPAQRPDGQRPAQRPDGQRPAQRPDGQRPAQRPDGQRPAQRPDGQRPAQRPEGQAPVQKAENQAQRPVQTAQAPQTAKPAEQKAARNFANDDDFEFEFLNYDGEEE